MDEDNLVQLQIIFDELSPPINMLAEIVYHEDQDYGVECKEIDIDSMLQLRSILSMHNSDPESIHLESQALWEKKKSENEQNNF